MEDISAPTVAVVNLGCRVNRVESDRMSADLARWGFTLADEDAADLVIINTCAVTGEAEAKTRKAVRHALGLPARPYVVATGCAVNLHPEALAALGDRVIVEPLKTKVAHVAADALGWYGAPVADDAGTTDLAAITGGRCRLGIKVQDGCNNRCTYCIVWKARGPERSRAVEDVLEEVRAAVAAGIPELVLTGVNLGAYRDLDAAGAPVDIAGLVDAVLERTDIPHVRLSSVEPMDVSDALIERMAANPRRVAPFIHLPIQSGCTATLSRMGRPYTADDLVELVCRMRETLPALALSGDLIVGFPGETDEEFEATRELVSRLGFARLHVFRYSARPGTPAATMEGQVAPSVMAERSATIRADVAESSRADAARRIGTVERAVVEYPGRGTLGSFHRVIIDEPADLAVGTIADVAIMYADEEGILHGRVRA
ncbi:MiaB/RimO family radical SAM methylthiotransferase [Collinsella tanakaei]|uniref:MiaB/RimO family radical SAM methylthiotransferase n=1 Tax=Collinsella tanakaei TaxID=626935 RepID=UPI00315D0A9C